MNRTSNSFYSPLLTSTCAAIFTLVSANTALAQGKDVDEELIVTGSHIRGVQDLPSPVDVYSSVDIEMAPRSTIGEFIHSTTIAPGSAPFGNVAGSGMSPGRTINLRGLGSRATLIIVNGRRNVNNSGPTQNGTVAVDVNSLMPSIMLDRVEILKDGGSALYGTDAVAGVVNFITRSDFEGVETSINYLTN